MRHAGHGDWEGEWFVLNRNSDDVCAPQVRRRELQHRSYDTRDLSWPIFVDLHDPTDLTDTIATAPAISYTQLNLSDGKTCKRLYLPCTGNNASFALHLIHRAIVRSFILSRSAFSKWMTLDRPTFSGTGSKCDCYALFLCPFVFRFAIVCFNKAAMYVFNLHETGGKSDMKPVWYVLFSRICGYISAYRFIQWKKYIFVLSLTYTRNLNTYIFTL